MSATLFADDVLFFQRLLRAEGLYLDELDGLWGPNTEAAAAEFDRRSEQVRIATRTFDGRSERNIASLSLKAQRLAREFLGRVLDGGLGVRIISGTRTYAEQNALFRQGRFGNPGPRVTNVRGGGSNHNFGIAWDIGVFTATGGYLTEGPEYAQAAALGRAGAAGLIEWGGDWTGFVDKPHFQLALGIDVSRLRVGFEAGSLGTAFA